MRNMLWLHICIKLTCLADKILNRTESVSWYIHWNYCPSRMVWYFGWSGNRVWGKLSNLCIALASHHLQEGRISCMLDCYFVNCEDSKYEEITSCGLHDWHYHMAPSDIIQSMPVKSLGSCSRSALWLNISGITAYCPPVVCACAPRLLEHADCYDCYNGTVVCASAGCFPWIFLPCLPLLLAITLNLYNWQVFSLHFGLFLLFPSLLLNIRSLIPQCSPHHCYTCPVLDNICPLSRWSTRFPVHTDASFQPVYTSTHAVEAGRSVLGKHPRGGVGYLDSICADEWWVISGMFDWSNVSSCVSVATAVGRRCYAALLQYGSCVGRTGDYVQL